MSKVSFEDIGMVTATFTAREDVEVRPSGEDHWKR